MFDSNRQRTMSFIIFGIYAFLLIWLILFKFTTTPGELGHIRNVNLIPFAESLVINGRINMSEIIYNILVFVPLGVGTTIFCPGWTFWKKAALCLGVSLVFEILQFAFAIGASDITDLMGNTLGGGLGIGLSALLEKLFKKRFITIVLVIGGVVEALALIMIWILVIGNM